MCLSHIRVSPSPPPWPSLWKPMGKCPRCGLTRSVRHADHEWVRVLETSPVTTGAKRGFKSSGLGGGEAPPAARVPPREAPAGPPWAKMEDAGTSGRCGAGRTHRGDQSAETPRDLGAASGLISLQFGGGECSLPPAGLLRGPHGQIINVSLPLRPYKMHKGAGAAGGSRGT